MTLSKDVVAAQRGDRAAFGRVVERFERMALGFAVGWLGDEASAEDAAQDAFLDAFLRLSQLREPAAFPGWFRRILTKHCDRRSRRRPVPAPEVPEGSPAPAEIVANRERSARLRSLIESLPAHERVVVALHYLGDEPQKDVADFLELPLSTVKKRLHSARKRLEGRRTKMEALKSTKKPAYADRIQLFLAIRAGDVDDVGRIVDGRPDLLDAVEQWSVEEALAGGFPLAHRSTPLVLSAARGDRALVHLLLEKGARPDERCGCDTGETALFAAAAAGHTEVVRALLAAGADPNAVNGVGHGPLHVAVMRGHTAVEAALLEGGADPTLRASNGRTPEAYRPALRSVPEPAGGRIETGIKAIDLLAPLERGMIVRVQGAAETGLMVLLSELSRRFGELGTSSVWAATASMSWHQGELSTFTRAMGIEGCVSVSAEKPLESVKEGQALFVFLEEGREAEVEAVLPRLLTRASIAFVVEPWIAVTKGERSAPALSPPYGAVICTSQPLAAEGIYPAIDPKRSCSLVRVDAEHARIAEGVREALSGDGPRAAAVKALLDQPFHVYTHQNGRPGEVVPLQATLAGFDRVLRSAE